MTKPGAIDGFKIVFRLCKPEDVGLLVDRHGQAFFTEAGFGEFSSFDPERARAKIARQVEFGISPFILADLNGETIGFASYLLEHTFTDRPIGMLWMFYVAPEHRGTSVSRLLLWYLVDLARGDGACAFFAVVAPTSPAARLLCNLFRRGGFARMGGAFMRRL